MTSRSLQSNGVCFQSTCAQSPMLTRVVLVVCALLGGLSVPYPVWSLVDSVEPHRHTTDTVPCYGKIMRITPHYSAHGAKSYYEVSDYYASGPEELKGKWLGHGAAHLGLEGDVDKEHFDRMVDNLHPTQDKRLTPRMREHRRYGWDVVFSAPKSFSLAYGLLGDDRLLDVFRQSLEETFHDFEQDAMTRVNTSRGKLHTETTGNLAAASWVHLTARPTPGQPPDPQIHGHIYTFNLTRDEHRNRWTAVDVSNIYRDTGYFNARFLSRLATKTNALGYQVERSSKGFEITGISRSVIDKFSKRSAEVAAAEKAVKDEYGLEALSAAAKGRLGARSRRSKSESAVAMEDLPDCWRSQLTDAEVNELDRVKHQDLPTREATISAKDAITHAADRHFEKQAVIRRRDLMRDAMLFGIGDASVQQIEDAFNARTWITEGQRGNQVVTTKAIQEEERQILHFARSTRGTMSPIAANHSIRRTYLGSEQQAAVTGVLNSTDQVIAIRGAAGTGKTTASKEAIEAMETNGVAVAVMAPTTKAAYGVLKDQDGFDATTIAAFLHDEERQQQFRNGVLWVDESGLVDNQTMLALMKSASELNARLVLVGDAKQHAPVGRGVPLKQLEEASGVRPFQITEIRRQEGSYREAVKHFSQGDVLGGLERLDRLGNLHELPDASRNATLARDYVDAFELEGEDPKKLLAIAPTHAERREVTDAIRQEMRFRNHLKGDDIELTTLHSRRLSKAERQDPLRYHSGDHVVFHAKGKGGFQPGDQVTIDNITNGRVFTTVGKELPLSSAGAFDVFSERKETFAKGDMIRITRKRRESPTTKRLNNGSVFQITSISPKHNIITLDNGEKINPATWQFFENGITLTSHAAQGSTVARAFVSQSSMSFPASSAEQLYVSASRARKRVDVYSDDIAALKHAVAKRQPAKAALDIAAAKPVSPMRNLTQSMSRAGRVAHQFATRQLAKFYDWLPSPVMQREAAR